MTTRPNLRKLSAAQLIDVLTAAGQLRWRARERFLAAVAQQLDGHEVGDGSVIAAVRTVMDQFYSERTVKL
jgi:hypothetical protein